MKCQSCGNEKNKKILKIILPMVAVIIFAAISVGAHFFGLSHAEKEEEATLAFDTVNNKSDDKNSETPVQKPNPFAANKWYVSKITTFDDGGSKEQIMEKYYQENGKFIKLYLGSGDEDYMINDYFTLEVKYDEHNQVTEITATDTDGELCVGTAAITYTEENEVYVGRGAMHMTKDFDISFELTYNQDNILISGKVYENGRLLGYENHDENGRLTEYFFDTGTGEGKKKYEYDMEGRLTKEIWYSYNDGTAECYIIYEYDKNKCIKGTGYAMDETDAMPVYSFEYDKDGKLIKKVGLFYIDTYEWSIKTK